MAGFCRNCGSPLGDGQAFCVKCGTRVGEAAGQAPAPAVPTQTPVAAGASQPSPGTPAAPPQAVAPEVAAGGAAPAAAKGSPLATILLIVVLVLVFFGAVGIAGVLYVGYRVRQKAHELGLSLPSAEERRQHVSTLGGIDACALLSKDEVSRAIGMEVVRAEADHGGSPGCAYSVQGDAGDLTTKHAIRMSQELSKGNQQAMTKSQQDTIENIGKTLFHGMATAKDSGLNEHPGETPVFSFVINDDAVQFQMKVDRATFSRIGPVGAADIPDLGDEAFDAAGAMLLVRKGDKLVRVMYMQCPCVKDDILPLVRKVVSGL